MAFNRPTLSQLVKRAQTDLATRLAGADPLLRRSVERALAFVQGGMSHGLHGHLSWAARQIIIDTADDEYLERWGGVWGIDRTPAVAASGEVTITGTNGQTSPAGTQWDVDGTIYSQDNAGTISGGSAVVTLTADEAGADGNQDAGVIMSIVSPVAGIDGTALVAFEEITGGVDIESIEALRSRILLRIQNPPKGGGPGDYVNWALEIAGVTRAWEFANYNGAGTVGVFFVYDGNSGSIVPTGDQVTAMQTHLDSKAPITAVVTAYAPTTVAFNTTAAIVPDTSAVQEAAEDEIADMLLREAAPGGTIKLSKVNEALSLAAGETDHTLTIPAADVTHTAGQLAIPGVATWS